jgi:hypothetical protein
MTLSFSAGLRRVTAAGVSAAIALLSSGPTAVGQVAGGKEVAPAGKGAKSATPPKQSAPASPTLAVPQPEVLLVLIRLSLVALRDAVQTGNFTVLRDLGAPTFQAANSAAQLGTIFADLRNRNIDLSPVVVVTPEMSEPPAITAENLLRLVGYFPTKPLQIKFQMLFQPVNGQWRLFGMSVDVVHPLPPAATAAVPKKSPANAPVPAAAPAAALPKSAE